MLQQALENSLVERQRESQLDSIASAPVFRPTLEQFKGGAIKYIESIREEAEKYGICKIVPPPGWNPPCCVDRGSTKPFRTRIQNIHRLQQGSGFDWGARNATQYQELARGFRQRWIDKEYATGRALDYKSLEEDYWRIVETGAEAVQVEYGNDLDTQKYWSGFPRAAEHVHTEEMNPDIDFQSVEYYKKCSWNVNNFPRNPGSVLRHIRTDINGVNVPWLYFGMLFSSFCWHNEDNYMYSVNYHHFGEPKQWYGVPGKDADKFEDAMRRFLKERFDEEPDLLHHMTTQISPSLLIASRVPIYRLRQYAGEFVVTFPKAFHGGFSYGLNCGEAVNFATPEWIEHGRDAALRYRRFARPSVLSHDRILLLLSYHLDDLDERAARVLLDELRRLKREEEFLRPELIGLGVKDVSKRVVLPPNRLNYLDSGSADYDEKRQCFLCQHICFLSAVACRCSRTRVACLHHESRLCLCSKKDKFMLCWASLAELNEIVRRVETYIQKISNPELDIEVPRLAEFQGSRFGPRKRERPEAENDATAALQKKPRDSQSCPVADGKPMVMVKQENAPAETRSTLDVLAEERIPEMPSKLKQRIQEAVKELDASAANQAVAPTLASVDLASGQSASGSTAQAPMPGDPIPVAKPHVPRDDSKAQPDVRRMPGKDQSSESNPLGCSPPKASHAAQIGAFGSDGRLKMAPPTQRT